MVNHALQDNPVAGQIHISTPASDWLWTVFAVMLLSMLAALLWHGFTVKHNRYYHQMPVIVLTVATITYFSMASDLGYTIVPVEFGRGVEGHPFRQVFYVRYIQWFINAPALLLGLLLLVSNFKSPDILAPMFFALVLVVMGLVGALTTSSYKWGYFAFGIFALFFIYYRLFVHSNLFDKHPRHYKGFYFAASYLAFFWMLYPVCWGLSEGGNVITPMSEMIFYGILDMFTGPVFILLFTCTTDPPPDSDVQKEKGGAGPGTSAAGGQSTNVGQAS